MENGKRFVELDLEKYGGNLIFKVAGTYLYAHWLCF